MFSRNTAGGPSWPSGGTLGLFLIVTKETAERAEQAEQAGGRVPTPVLTILAIRLQMGLIVHSAEKRLPEAATVVGRRGPLSATGGRRCPGRFSGAEGRTPGEGVSREPFLESS